MTVHLKILYSDKNDPLYKHYDWYQVKNHRVRFADFIPSDDGKGRRLDVPNAFLSVVQTPWGTKEKCFITPVSSYSGGWEFYATVKRPKTNKGVSFSTFWVDPSQL